MTKPIIPYMGGKQRLVKKISPMLPEHTCYAEPFAGGLALLLAKEPSKCEVVNDISEELINLYRVLQHHPGEFFSQFEYLLSSRKQFQEFLAQESSTLTDIQNAVRYFYLQKLCFGGVIESKSFGTATTSRARLNQNTLRKKVGELNKRLQGVFIENLDWKKVIEKYDRPHTLFYCDPPYWKTSGYGVPFPFEQYEKLCSYMKSVKGMMVISINNHPDVRKLFRDFKQLPLKTTYTTGKARKQVTELLIFNDHAAKNMEVKKAA